MEVGAAFYNFSTFGITTEMARTSDGHFLDYRSGMLPVLSSTKVAESYLKRAVATAKDKETKAKATFMLAKCEYANTPSSGEYAFKAGDAFHALKKLYAKTRYYREVLAECGFFRTFIGSN